MRAAVAGTVAAAAICACFYNTGIYLTRDRADTPEGKRDFRMDVGHYSLPRRETPQEVRASLEQLLAVEMRKQNLCPHGYEVTRDGCYAGCEHHWVEGVCK
jgi:hypothetical protein